MFIKTFQFENTRIRNGLKRISLYDWDEHCDLEEGSQYYYQESIKSWVKQFRIIDIDNVFVTSIDGEKINGSALGIGIVQWTRTDSRGLVARFRSPGFRTSNGFEQNNNTKWIKINRGKSIFHDNHPKLLKSNYNIELIHKENFGGLESNFSYCWRVRFRDSGLEWSDWSTPTAFSTGESVYSANLLSNPGAENGIEDWIIREGIFESLLSGDCAGINPNSGDRYFSVGGLCTESEYAEVYQSIYIGDNADCIDSGGLGVLYSGYLSDWNGNDHPEFKLEFDNGFGNIISESPILDSYSTSWEQLSNQMTIPNNTRVINFVMMGTRYNGTDNDSYFDDMELRLLNNCDNVLFGDLNDDGIINVIDIIRMVNIVLGEAATDYEMQVGDLNGDGIINVIDIIQVVNIILAG